MEAYVHYCLKFNHLNLFQVKILLNQSLFELPVKQNSEYVVAQFLMASTSLWRDLGFVVWFWV